MTGSMTASAANGFGQVQVRTVTVRPCTKHPLRLPSRCTAHRRSRPGSRGRRTPTTSPSPMRSGTSTCAPRCRARAATASGWRGSATIRKRQTPMMSCCSAVLGVVAGEGHRLRQSRRRHPGLRRNAVPGSVAGRKYHVATDSGPVQQPEDRAQPTRRRTTGRRSRPICRASRTSPQCDRFTGAGCALLPTTDDPAIGGGFQPAAFYPFYSTTGTGTSCRWQLGSHMPDSTNDFGQNAQYGTAARTPATPRRAVAPPTGTTTSVRS